MDGGVNDGLKEYLRKEWRYNCAAKYQRYFEQWFDNLTDIQIKQYSVWMSGKMGPFNI